MLYEPIYIQTSYPLILSLNVQYPYYKKYINSNLNLIDTQPKIEGYHLSETQKVEPSWLKFLDKIALIISVVRVTGVIIVAR